MGLIIPVSYLAKVLPSDALDSNSEQTNAITEASAFVNTWTSKHYESWEAYTDNGDDTYTINAPSEIVYVARQVAKHMYFMNIGSVQRDGAEEVDHEQRIEYYRNLLEKIQVKPTEHTLSISLDSDGYQIIAQRQNILTHKANIVSGSTNVWNLGKHFRIIKGSAIDSDDYLMDGWYLDGSNYASTLEGTLHYWRSYRNDGRDYMATFVNRLGHTSG